MEEEGFRGGESRGRYRALSEEDLGRVTSAAAVEPARALLPPMADLRHGVHGRKLYESQKP